MEQLISDKRSVRDLTEALPVFGVRDVVISPGSRNAPITNSLFNHPAVRCLSVVDERSAGFFALGIARASGRPVATVCTSGSALMNYGPAAAEALYQQIPLIIISADRPENRIDKGEGQSIRQPGALSTVVKGSFSLRGESETEEEVAYNQQQISAALALANTPPLGPVHINVPLREGLYGMISHTPAETPSVNHQRQPGLDEEFAQRLAKKFSSKNKILILTGMLNRDEGLNAELHRLAESNRVLVMTESISNLHSPWFIGCTDRLVTTFSPSDTERFTPDLIITIGHSIISRKIKALVRQSGVEEHWHIGPEKNYDTFDILKEEISANASEFLSGLEPKTDSGRDYGHYFRTRNQQLADVRERLMADTPFSDLKAFHIILSQLPRNERLEAGNSSVIRYAQLFDPRPDIFVNANRGVSGIDGCTSTAVGAAFAGGQNTTLITGDLAFLYDSNALWCLPRPSNLKIIVINNGGGNIFRIIDGPDQYPAVDDFFVARHERTLRPMIEAHGIACFEARDEKSLEEGLTRLFAEEQMAVLEVFTPDRTNPLVLKNYFARLKKHIE